MNDYKTVTYKREGRIAYLMFNRPEALNTMNDELERETRAALLEYDLDDEAWVMILHGAGKCFCAGVDLRTHGSFALGKSEDEREAGQREAARTRTIGAAQHLLGTGGEGWMGRTINYKPVIAAVHGYALGGGAHIAAECDLIVAAEDASFAISETTRGMSGSRTWSKIRTFMPSKIANEMLMTGARIPAAELHRLGLINRVVPNGQHLAAAEELAHQILAAPPLAVRDAVRVSRRLWVQHATQLDHEMQLTRLDLTEDFKEAGQAFVQKRVPKFSAR
ncbi:enoyl-CoA hydratase/isomerase family protein [Burkholderia seminalis]|uniref:Enoyl-CoA hydratase/isomerase family protein n=2 Tax=Burkholderia cepacia complex TaxID=87882 RepID=A0A8A8DFT3_9BURK|nr:enoyl-CoA hydratase-related protein [Burkholderia seminalis]QTO23330.1 enoyl-CoA hydratase/isomerase family protein [Burkholderia seminalis]